MSRGVARLTVGLALSAAGLGAVLVGAPASVAAEGDIDRVRTTNGTVEVLFSLRDLPDGAAPDVDSLVVTIDGEQQVASAESASSDASLQRQTILAIDTSDSMAGEPFKAAKSAALAFLDQAPSDVEVGVVAFAGEVSVVQEPTTDRAALREAVTGLSISRLTRLYDGVLVALETLTAGVEGGVLVLSDGRDTSAVSVNTVRRAVRSSGARLDVVALDQSGRALDILASIAGAGGGTIANTADTENLQQLFEARARVLESQLVVTLDAPSGWEGGDATVDVSVTAQGESYSDSALVQLPATAAETAPDTTLEPLPADQPSFDVTRPMMLGGLGALAVGSALLVMMMTGTFQVQDKQSLGDRLAPYGLSTAGHHNGRGNSQTGGGVVTKAVDATDKMLRGGGLDVRLAKKLDAAGMSIHAAEWLLLHAGITVGAGFVGFALTSRPLVAVIALLAGGLMPWIYLRHKESKRIKTFGSQLADTLQLISGSLSAGMSLTQSLDTVVREGNEPVAGEFRRALVEQRLGVEVEIALEGVATRMKSDDFSWVVMAIRIQRDVGGNLAELLLTVAGTLREREYLRRQVKTLSAEGRISAWILGGLPPAFFCYLLLVQPTYLDPMLQSTLGWLMLGGAGVMMAIGVVALKQMVKVEV